MKRFWVYGLFMVAAALVLSTNGQAQATRGSGKLTIYFVDVEGGQATLFITPAGESLLIDTGWQGRDGRDADRIVAAAKKAGLQPDRLRAHHPLP